MRLTFASIPDLDEPGFGGAADGTHSVTPETFFENFWQSAKVYSFDMPGGWVPPQPHETRIERPSQTFFDRRTAVINNSKPKRRPLPKARGTPVASYLYGRIMGYLAARKVYCTLYENSVKDTPMYKRLLSEYLNSEAIMIIGPDVNPAYDITYEDMRRAYEDTTKPFGHEYVLCCMLCGWRFW
jgi:hypothetical protein